ncbi:lactococcin 972 family bacteriocin [Nocardioides sp.]|uniref:lactococcin 972 family bacteriocin n=1 Tax=Nocardioides sp. TaxID=35761 RepID=UPI002CEF4E70|nr:lactococcin 972 family bacteriocin [Nocardioides sp.]HXH80315.1 lactococcin 972 family bacteriocin [Nocardioides sp.]
MQKSSIIVTCAIAAAGVLMTASPVAASPAAENTAEAFSAKVAKSNKDSGITIIAQGETADGGWVAFTGLGRAVIDGSDSVQAPGASARAVVSAGGGTWAYGSTRTLSGQKVCYSQYDHADVDHGSSVKMDGETDSSYVGAGYVSNARVDRYTTQTCYAYWRK